MLRFRLSALLVFACCWSASRAQQIDTVLAIYQEQYQPEKLYMHFDKSLYTQGDTIWFKAYLLAGDNLSDYSRNVYADWYDESGRLITHTVHPVFNSSARGQFALPKNYPGGKLLVRAYTRWMLNFDSAFLFTRELRVAGTRPPADTKSSIATSIRFLPEGGSLVNGISSNIAFIAVSQAGLPVAVRGAIVNNKNELVDSFASVHDGMGVFMIEPAAGETYTCNWIDAYGTSHTTPLPTAAGSGVVMEASVRKDKAVFMVKRSAVGSNLASLHIVATINQQVVYQAAMNLSAKTNAAAEIPLAKLPSGVLQVTVFDAAWKPLAERVLFNRNMDREFTPSVQLVSRRLSPRLRNELEITVEDTVLSNMSVSVTDADLAWDSTTNIFSQLLLQGDIKGTIPNAAYYFSSDNETVRSHLDLVMLTHGWRKYQWDDIVQAKMPLMRFPADSDYAQIKGRVYTNGQASIRPGQTLSLVMQAKDSSRQYFTIPLAANGSFVQRGLIYFDTPRVFYQIMPDKSLNNVATVSFQYGLPQTPYLSSVPVNRLSAPDSALLQNSYLFYSQLAAAKKSFDTVRVLQEVTVTTKAKTPTEILDEKYTTGLFSGKNAYMFDIMNDERTRGQQNLFYYLQNTIPGLSMSIPILGQNGAEDANSSNAPGLNWRDGTPDIFVNEVLSSAESVMGIPMSDIAYVKVFRPPFMASSGSGASGAIAVYTRKAGDRRTDMIKGLNSALLTGYSPYKEFYSPDYTIVKSKAADTRTTLYWNPYVITDGKNRTARLSFFNNDVTKRFRIILEGVNAAGKLTRVEKIIE